MFSPELWRKLIKPYLAKQVALARGHGMYVFFHSCGNVRVILPDLIDIGVNAHLVFQTTASEMGAEAIARDFGGRLAFYGGMDVQQLLSFGTPDDVAKDAYNARAFEKHGGYIVANSHHCVSTIQGANTRQCARRLFNLRPAAPRRLTREPRYAAQRPNRRWPGPVLLRTVIAEDILRGLGPAS